VSGFVRWRLGIGWCVVGAGCGCVGKRGALSQMKVVRVPKFNNVPQVSIKYSYINLLCSSKSNTNLVLAHQIIQQL
jgi:hypothetical protein